MNLKPSSTIVVIGCNSFSGAHFATHCLQKGHRVIGISRSAKINDVFLPYEWPENQTHAGAFEFHQLDLNQDIGKIGDLIKKELAPYVVNFAAQSMVAQSWDNPEHWYQTNVVATINLHERLRQFDFLDRYVHISTPEVYGHCEGVKQECREYFPSTPYAISRAAADMSLHAYHQAYDFPVVFTRAANVFGAGQQLYRIVPRAVLNLMSDKIIPLHGGGLSERCFIHISDVSDATYKIMNSGEDGEIYHISTDHIVSIRELVEIICKRLDKPFDSCVESVGERLGKDAAYVLANDKLKQLGWQAAYNLDQGIDDVVTWVDRNIEILKTLPSDYIHKA